MLTFIIFLLLVISALLYLIYLYHEEAKHQERQISLMGDEIHKLNSQLNVAKKNER